MSFRKQETADPKEAATPESAIAAQQARSAESVFHAVQAKDPRSIT
jgi:hypothetical protein